jgi:hypothetical protein
LENFSWIDICSLQEAQQDISLDPVLQALPACPHLKHATIFTKCASTDTVRNLMHSPRLTSLSLKLNTEHWLAVANEIQHGRNKIRVLGLAMFEGTSSEATAALKAIASAIRRDRNLVGLMVGLTNGFMDEEGVALAEALTVIKTLRWVVLADTSTDVHTRATLGARAYEAFSAMLRVNTSLTRLDLPPLDRAGGDQRLVESYDQMRIEQGLNKVAVENYCHRTRRREGRGSMPCTS